jgi:hypothetical protein
MVEVRRKPKGRVQKHRPAARLVQDVGGVALASPRRRHLVRPANLAYIIINQNLNVQYS